MISFKEFKECLTIETFDEAISDPTMIKRKRLNDRTPRQQAALDAAKRSKPIKGAVEVHLKHEDGSVSKSKFKLMKNPAKWDEEAKEIAIGHLKNMQSMHDRFPDLVKDQPKPVEVHKTVIK